MANRRRSFRVAERIQALVAQDILRMGDPRFSLVTITSAAISPDLRQAKIYWLVHGDKERRVEVQEAFEGASRYIRRTIADALGTRIVPELRFYYDNSLDEAERMDRLFESIRQGEKKHA